MRFWPIPILVLLAGVGLAAPAHASSDDDCNSHLKVQRRDFARCDGLTVLSPGNDTRINLLLLLLDHDRQPLPPGSQPEDVQGPLVDWRDLRRRWAETSVSPVFAAGEGSRCHSDAGGIEGFSSAVRAARDLTQGERDALIAARRGLDPKCVADPKAPPAAAPLGLAPMASPIGRGFATYLRGTDAFYAGRYEEAAAAFAELHGQGNAWLADAGDYMVGRTELNELQVPAFDEYGSFTGSAHVDQALADRATATFRAYLRDHPAGAYAGSARGLMRRVDWLAARTEKLAAGYATVIAVAPDKRNANDGMLAEEIGDALLPTLAPEMTRDPILLASFDLFAMRDPKTPRASADPAPRRPDLESQRAAFATAPLLFDYLLATQAFYLDHDPAKVMTLLPDDTKRRDGDHLWFSRQVLRGLALEERHDRNARGFWKELYAGTTRPLDQQVVQLALALHDERAGTPGDVFAPGSIVTNAAFRGMLIEKTADAALLRKIAGDATMPESDRKRAGTTLLDKELTRGRYADFLRDIALAPGFAVQEAGDFHCPDLETTAGQLARDPEATRPRLCLGNYLGAHGTDTLAGAADELGGGPSLFPGKRVERAAIYRSIIADEDAPANDRAYALYRAVKCYEPSGVNDCGGADVPKPQRARWYNTLKHDYPGSSWAKNLRFWW